MVKKRKNKLSIPGLPSLEEYTANQIDLWISTELDPLDFIINPLGGGIPAGRITVIYGEESSGKSTLLAHIFKSCQRLKIECIICDAENTFDADFASRVGMDPTRLGVLQVRSIEELDTALHKTVKKFYSKQPKDAPFLVGIDSIEALDVERYIKKRKRMIGDRARTWGPFWRSVSDLQRQFRHFTVVALNQVRSNIQTSVFSSGPQETTPGGRALGFYSSLGIRLKCRKTLTNPKKGYQAYASVIQAKIAKSKIGTPFRQCLIYNKFSKGFDNPKTIIYFLANNGVLKKPPGEKTVYGCGWFSMHAEIDGKAKKIEKLKLSQARAFLDKFGWEALSESIKEEWLK